MLPPPRRRRLRLASAALLPLPGLARAGIAPPAFDRWVDRTAVLQALDLSVRLYLCPDSTGTLSTRLGVCWKVEVRRWRVGPNGLRLDYVRRSVLDASREISGDAHLDPEARAVHWREDGKERTLELLALDTGDTTARC